MLTFEPTVEACRARFRSYDVFGAKITPTTIDDLLELLQSYVTAKRQCIVASQNLHGLKVMVEVPDFQALHALPDTYVHIDGMPLVALCRLQGVAALRRHRVTVVDWIRPLLRLACSSGWRVFYLGATEEVLSSGLHTIRKEFPGLDIAGRNGYFDVDDALANAGVVATITKYRPHILLVGMGMGRQEPWILRHRQSIEPASICTVGACMEYIAGAVRTPPRWMGRAGLEWLFRLTENPHRFAHRYLVEPWSVVAHILRRLSTSRR